MSNKPKDRAYRPLVYVCSPMARDIPGNMEQARKFCRFALERGQIPLAPHLLFPQFMDDADPEEREIMTLMDIVLLGKCSELWVFGDPITEGMNTKIEVAKRRRQPVRYFNNAYEEVEAL